MTIFISGYFGFGNAGDEAVLAAMLLHLGRRFHGTHFIVASGNPAQTALMHASPDKAYALSCVARDDFGALSKAVSKCHLFLSGGGSLMQDVTSLRNVAYYCGLLRLARFKRKRNMIYAQGIGPLHQTWSHRLVRMATAKTHAITVRDEASKVLLHSIHVKNPIKVTADPVWALEADKNQYPIAEQGKPLWGVSLRSWPGQEDNVSKVRVGATLAALRDLSQRAGAKLLFLPMQSGVDDVLLAKLGVSKEAQIQTTNIHPTKIMAQTRQCQIVIAMRLHALIFAASQGVPTVAINYDPKVAALAKILQIPLLEATECSQSAKLEQAITSARTPNPSILAELKEAALRNAEIAKQVMR